MRRQSNFNLSLTKEKIKCLANDCKEPRLAEDSMMAEFNSRLMKNRAENKLKLLRELNRRKLCLSTTESLCKKLCNRFPLKARILAKRVTKWMIGAINVFNI